MSVCQFSRRNMTNINTAAAKYLVQPTNLRKFVTHLNKPGVLLPVILLEATVTGGRTYQAQKRGGFTEARERACEETVGAVFWLGGVKFFNWLGDKFGQKFLGIKNPEFSLAKDSVRHPFENMVRNQNISDSVRKKLVAFKFTKVATAVVLAGGFLGFVVPKINQKVTKKLLNHDSKKNENKNKNIFENPSLMNVKYEGMDNFIKKRSASPSFGLSIDKFATITNNLENHDIYKLLATDTGVLAGRTYNARNKDERVEILFRDGASIYFYLASTKHIINFLNKHDGYGGKLSKLDPMTAMNVHNALVKQLVAHNQKPDTPNVDLAEMKKFGLGSDIKAVQEKVDKFNFKNGNVLSLEEFYEQAKSLGMDFTSKEGRVMRMKAHKLASLQPEVDRSYLGKEGVGKIITKWQVFDLLNDNAVSDPKFLLRVMRDSFNGGLTDPYQYVNADSVEKLRENINKYVNGLIEFAEKEKINELTPDFMLKYNKRNLLRNGLHIGAGLGISAIFLSTVIPKLQYLITKMRTGSDKFPGVENSEK